MTAIITAAATIGLCGLIIGLLLGLAGKLFSVDADERVSAVRECLPGNNCGGCGYAGCDALAEAVVKGEAETSACPVGGAEAAGRIAAALGIPKGNFTRKTAFIKCAGSDDKTGERYIYTGNSSCVQMALAPGHGSKACIYGCLGGGSCAEVCPFKAISLTNGLAYVDKEKCKACGKCIEICPRKLIVLIPYETKFTVHCSSEDKGKTVREICDTGCIGCGICQRLCRSGAVTLINNIAGIDPDKCTGCGRCAEKCPAKVIFPAVSAAG